jgi:glutamate--cysteine ligase
MRGADVGPPERIVALSAFWIGLLYDRDALDAAWDLVKEWSAEDRETLRADVAKQGLTVVVRGRSVREIARDVIDLSRRGLARRARLDAAGRDESIYLDPLLRIVDSGRVPAQELLDLYHGRWERSVLPAFSECVF